jgi:hypothetical protein
MQERYALNILTRRTRSMAFASIPMTRAIATDPPCPQPKSSSHSMQPERMAEEALTASPMPVERGLIHDERPHRRLRFTLAEMSAHPRRCEAPTMERLPAVTTPDMAPALTFDVGHGMVTTCPAGNDAAQRFVTEPAAGKRRQEFAVTAYALQAIGKHCSFARPCAPRQHRNPFPIRTGDLSLQAWRTSTSEHG